MMDKGKSKIRNPDDDTFYEAIEQLNQRGVIFDADFESLTITLTGGYQWILSLMTRIYLTI